MKTVYVVQRIFRAGNTEHTFPIGAFEDQATAKKMMEEDRTKWTKTPPVVKQVLDMLGVQGVGSIVVEVPFVPGTGLVVVPSLPRRS
jgi:hypothetical protein